MASPTALSASLRDAARAVPAKAGKALGLNSVRRLALGPELVQSTRALDRQEAETLMRQLAADPNVQSVEVDQILHATLTPNDTRLSEQWGFGTTNAGLNIRPAWDKASGTGVVVAVIDTGITTHADLNANILPGYDFVSDATAARDGNGRDSNPADEGDWYAANECGTGIPAFNSSWHGTHVAGTVAAVTNNSTGVAGTAFNAKVVPVRVLARCGGSLSDISDGIVWASGGTVSGVPANANPAEVINMSLGGGGACSPTLQNAINGAVSRGTTVVVAAGNDSANVSGSLPANCANVIAVAATTSAGAKASFSNFGAGIDVSGPGQAILSTLNSGTTTPGSASYASYDGTSMAAPHVAGVVALVQSVAPTALTPAAVETLLKNTARALPGACSGGCGAGIVNADAAVTAAISGSNGGGGTGNTLTNGTPVTGLGASTGAELNYTIAVPAGSGTLTVAISGGSGDADLYVRAGSAPTDSSYTCRPYRSGNAETCTISAPSGTYYVRVKAYSTFSGVTLSARY
ncbi:S8 family peptidase [Xanthomonas hortorum]|uniref:S8 family peptidase n=1 Tax=Xanthomonas hortorum TaxID=56454 RepID=UPI001F2EC91E|nr:S8 family peptidase [Xanthomonas hortorum]MCE4362981.1 S8 family serine peptidase [Xanthomonas hortorum]